MKENILIIALLISYLSLGQNLITNGNFETGDLSPWTGFKNQVVIDDLTNSRSGNINNGDGSLVQTFTVTPGETYNVVFNYRWVAAGGTNMTARVLEGVSGGSELGSFVLSTIVDVWHTDGAFSFTVPNSVTTVRIVFYKANGNRPLRIDNVYVSPGSAATSGFVDSETPVNAQPNGVPGDWTLDFSDEFNATEINTSKWQISVSTKSRNPRPNLGVTDWWWVAENAFLNGTGNLVLRGTKVDNNTMNCGSIESRGLYEPTYGYLEARIQIAETSKGNHTAFWLQGSNMGNVDNSAADGAEVDIFESAWVTNDTKAVVHFDGYSAFKKNHTIPYNTPNLHNGYHTFGLHWTETAMDIYYDGVKVVSTNANKPFPFTVDPNGYSLVPQVPEWLWLSVGASFGDGDFQSHSVGTLSDALVDYVRVYKPFITLGLEDNTSKDRFRLFPNPSKNIVHIKSNESSYDLKIYDLNGRVIINSKNLNSSTIDVSDFNKGLYVFKIISNDEVSTYKVIVN
ncbi:MAG: family 16 glycosylhydrolase [Algibacter sp.]|uniref:T9SS type A sorting domain-containing protein n=1 Tax=Algibacter sp. TaxID=1872428 RepID=UPI0026323F94|nr:T9SS type A sorting domain-containing protein [Algibacter sp.]MDG1730696.1 family 16 glycosylhydrolase [Algibacter sp.]MDG2177647.1 family 16 glycosylhydrolase [Algibacter sp.]